MKKTDFGKLISVVGLVLTFGAIFKAVVIGGGGDVFYGILALLGLALWWVGTKVHNQGKISPDAGDSIDSFEDAVSSITTAVQDAVSKDRRGNIKTRFERRSFVVPTNQSLSAVMAIADAAAAKATPMAHKFARENVESTGQSTVIQYVLRSGLVDTPKGAFNVTYVVRDASGNATVSVEMEDVLQERIVLFWFLPIGPVTSPAVVPFENFSDLIRTELTTAQIH